MGWRARGLRKGGTAVPIEIGTLCAHGDSDSALEILKASRLALESAGLRVCH